MLTLLKSYIQIKTSVPEPDYKSAITFLKDQADADGFKTNIVTLPSGYPVIIITLEGTEPELPALLLNHHMDVVPAFEEQGWVVPPFEGGTVDGTFVGRGTQDMKGVGIVHYAALCELKKIGSKRTVHLIGVPDEERGGFKGTKEFVALPVFKDLNVGFVLDEGLPSGSHTSLFIKVSERTPMQVLIRSEGKSAHGSFLAAHNPAYDLIDLLNKFKNKHKSQSEAAGSTAPGLLFSYHVTSLLAGSQDALNVVPAIAEATIDIRVPPHASFEEVLRELDELMAQYPGMSYHVLATSKERMTGSPTDTPFYQTLANAIQENGFKAEPFYFEATTDTRFYTSMGLEGLGLTPFRIAPNLHGINEAIYLDDLDIGKKVIVTFLQHFCA